MTTPKNVSELRVALENDMELTMSLSVNRLALFVSWVESGNWTLENIAQMLCTIGAGGRSNGKELDRDTFKYYVKSLTAASSQLGENPSREFIGSLDSISNKKPKDKKGLTVIATDSRFLRKGAKDDVFRVATISTKEKKAIRRPLDDMPMPDDIIGFVEESAELTEQMAADMVVATRIYDQMKQLDLANVTLANLPDPTSIIHGDSLKLPLTKLQAFTMHMGRVAWRNVAKDQEIANLTGELETAKLAVSTLTSELETAKLAVSPKTRAKRPA